MVNDVLPELERFQRHLLALDCGALGAATPDMVSSCMKLIENEGAHEPLLRVLFRFLQSPSGTTSPVREVGSPQLGTQSLKWTFNICIDVREPFGGQLSVTSLRNWFMFVNEVITSCAGSEQRLSFKYKTFPLLCVVAFHLARGFPEFLSKFNDYLDQWQTRHAFDTKALKILTSALRGDSSSLAGALAHAESQIAAHFIMLRQEYMSSAADGSSTEVAGAESEASLYPRYLTELLSTWDSMSERTPIAGEGSDAVVDWYKNSVGNILLASISARRDEVWTKYSIERFKGLSPTELQPSMGQLLVLLKREFKTRTQLVQEELQMLSCLDSRHSVLVRKYDIYARLFATFEEIELRERQAST
eukprot:Gregarina_sp_Poly_1__1982@NODE_151_length_12545_cov_99_072047_g134_i0_p5_GENE_NODE_151_length_12545_cov_99_072047_g134_i0NODE_151_length_12545_cov_99_072047_g134_i0_p5_ORF_typecomplete_len361_score47_81_NODE_151_length_12545_cov_99_072047_g134_i037474829